MRRVRGVDTKPELLVRKYLFKNEFRYRLYQKNLPGTPDLILKKYKTVIFINGCFWHGHQDCKSASLPKTRTQFWYDKIQRNKQRDKINCDNLALLGWKVLTIYECDLKGKNIDMTMSTVIDHLRTHS